MDGDSLPALFKDLNTAFGFLNQSQKAQSKLGECQTVDGKFIPLGQGLLASTSVTDTGFCYTYGSSLHIEATGWYLIAALGGNSFQLGYVSIGR